MSKSPKIELISVKNFLIQEYGYLSQILDGATECQRMDLTVKEIVVSNEIWLRELVSSDLTDYDRVTEPIIVRKLNNSFILVDGYHRFARKVQKNESVITAIVII